MRARTCSPVVWEFVSCIDTVLVGRPSGLYQLLTSRSLMEISHLRVVHTVHKAAGVMSSRSLCVECDMLSIESTSIIFTMLMRPCESSAPRSPSTEQKWSPSNYQDSLISLLLTTNYIGYTKTFCFID